MRLFTTASSLFQLNMKNIHCLLFLLYSYITLAQTKYYNFNIYDGKKYLSTMSQTNDLMLNSLRYVGNEINNDSLSKKEKRLYGFGVSLFSIVGQPITHEEGHRSVLTELGIGSVSEPFLNKNLVAQVTGVTDATLINLRSIDFPNYIRLHSGGLESDYAYLKKTDAVLNFNEEKHNIVYQDYFVRTLGTEFYYLSLLFKSKVGLKEIDTPELERDIVGHDLYGMIRHLHRPTMNFFRYTEFEDLTNEEKSYAKRVGLLSLINFLNPNIWKKKSFVLSKNVNGNFSVNYSSSPFGDFVEQNAYLNLNNKLKINPYFRQYFNKNSLFLATGINLHNYELGQGKYLLNASIDTWNQPKNQDFNTRINEFGYSLKSDFAIRFTSWNESTKSAYFNIGISYKTKGFIPEAPSLKEDFRINVGFVLSVKQ